MKKYDAIIIGSGQAGNPLARHLAKEGWKVALIEKDQIGGSCINYGCTPTKTMIASAKNIYQARRAKEYGFSTGEITIDLKAIVARKNKVVEMFRGGDEKHLKIPNLDVILGTASFSEIKKISVSTKDGGVEELTAEHIFINTGDRPSVPEIKGIHDVSYLTSTSILDLTTLPEHLIIVGAGYIALEFGQLFSRFGSKVTILEKSNRFLSKEDQDVADEMQTILEDEGIKLIKEVTVEHVSETAREISIHITVSGNKEIIKGTHLLLATGRVPNTEELHLSKTGVNRDEKGYITVNNKLETSASGIYALGDVKGGPAFTHISYNDYLVVYKNIIEKANCIITDRILPYCIYTDPELGRVGITEEEANSKGLNFKVAKLKMNYVARGIESGETKGFMKAIIDVDSELLLGVAIIGFGGGELMSLLQIAMLGKITYKQLKEEIFAHPSYSESINNLFIVLDK